MARLKRELIFAVPTDEQAQHNNSEVDEPIQPKRRRQSDSPTPQQAQSKKMKVNKAKAEKRKRQDDDSALAQPQSKKTKVEKVTQTKRKREDEPPALPQPEQKKLRCENAAEASINKARATDEVPTSPDEETAVGTSRGLFLIKKGIKIGRSECELRRVRTGRENPPLRLKDEDQFQQDLKAAVNSEDKSSPDSSFLGLGFDMWSIPKRPWYKTHTEVWKAAQKKNVSADAPKDLLWREEWDKELLEEWENDPVLPVTTNTMEVEYDAKGLKKFARHGGADLRSWTGKPHEHLLSMMTFTQQRDLSDIEPAK
ncbi:MAG: hypothetical protein MMC33_001084 [Icmadophila ericetorum]|nr:hypothetical protein [Icmadophila ericetorum]